MSKNAKLHFRVTFDGCYSIRTENIFPWIHSSSIVLDLLLNKFTNSQISKKFYKYLRKLQLIDDTNIE